VDEPVQLVAFAGDGEARNIADDGAANAKIEQTVITGEGKGERVKAEGHFPEAMQNKGRQQEADHHVGDQARPVGGDVLQGLEFQAHDEHHGSGVAPWAGGRIATGADAVEEPVWFLGHRSQNERGMLAWQKFAHRTAPWISRPSNITAGNIAEVPTRNIWRLCSLRCAFAINRRCWMWVAEPDMSVPTWRERIGCGEILGSIWKRRRWTWRWN